MNVVSFSLFGSNLIYSEGAVRNAELVHSVLPGWTCVYYVPGGYDRAVCERLTDAGALLREGDPAIRNEMFWRFLIADDPTVDRFVVRDTDSRLIYRDARAIEAWIDSGLPFHSVRDHPHHTLPLGGGLWGAVKGALPPLRPLILASELADSTFVRQTQYGMDQTFLSNYVWPVARDRVLQHDSCNRHLYPSSLPFPDGCQLGDWRFVGEVIDANDTPRPCDWQMRINHMTP